ALLATVTAPVVAVAANEGRAAPTAGVARVAAEIARNWRRSRVIESLRWRRRARHASQTYTHQRRAARRMRMRRSKSDRAARAGSARRDLPDSCVLPWRGGGRAASHGWEKMIEKSYAGVLALAMLLGGCATQAEEAPQVTVLIKPGKVDEA